MLYFHDYMNHREGAFTRRWLQNIYIFKKIGAK